VRDTGGTLRAVAGTRHLPTTQRLRRGPAACVARVLPSSWPVRRARREGLASQPAVLRDWRMAKYRCPLPGAVLAGLCTMTGSMAGKFRTPVLHAPTPAMPVTL